jgi:hypothetical protein
MVMDAERIERIRLFLERGETKEAIKSIVDSIEQLGDQPRMNLILIEEILKLTERIQRLEGKLKSPAA